jgi:pimeloyl-ACP methyl ester carboxylesterase
MEKMITMLEIEGTGIACRVNDDGFVRGRTLLFVHGSGGDHTVWDGQFDALERDFNMAALDLPGHGQSGGGGEEDVYRYVEWVRKTIKMLSIERPVVVGHSLGGAITLALGLTYPGIISGLIIVGGAARMPVSQMVFDAIRDNFKMFVELSPDYAVHRENREDVKEALLKGFSRARPEVFFGDFAACNRFDVEGQLGDIALPTLIVCGDKDMMMPPKYSEELHEKIAGSRLEIIPQCGHFPMLEKSAAFTTLIREFLETLE